MKAAYFVVGDAVGVVVGDAVGDAAVVVVAVVEK